MITPHDYAAPARSMGSHALVVPLIAALALLGLAACATGPAVIDEVEEVVDGSPAEVEEVAAPNVEGQPDWAAPVTTQGEKIATVAVGDLVVEVFQVDVVAATTTGSFANPDTGRPIIDVGDDIVFVNYVVSNVGDPIDLGFSLVVVDPRYDDWPYLQGMDGIVDSALFAQVGVNRDGFGPDSYRDPGVYTLGTGERISWGQNFPYQKGSPISFRVTVTPVDAEGHLVHDKRAEATGSGTIG